MKSKNQNQSGNVSGDRAQLILIGGLVVAVAVIAIALVIGGGLFSQSTTDDGGLSSFTSQTDDQVQAAATVGQQDVEYVNENSTLFQGAYPDEICGELADKAAVQQLVSTQLGEGESVTSIEVLADCSNNVLNNASWVVGQGNPNYNLPSVNASDSGGPQPVDVVFAVDTSGSMDSSAGVTKSWEKPPHGGDFPRDVYRPDTGVTVPPGWLDVQCATTVTCSWDTTIGSSGDIVFDNANNRIARVTSTNPATGDADVEYRDGSTAQVSESDLFNFDYRLDAPERMWFTQKGLKNALGDLDDTEPDRAGLIEYDTGQTVHADVEGVDDPSHVDDIKEETDEFMPGGGTDIADVVEEGKKEINDDPTDATKNIVVLSDGEHNPTNDGYSSCGPANAYDCSIAGNQGDYEDIYIHAVILGSDAANDVDAVSDMAKITNDPDPDLEKSSVTESQLPARNDPRNEGTLIASDDPSDAQDIFKDIVDDIQATTDDSATGEVEEIQDIRMNVTDFQGNGTYLMEFNNGSDVIWQMEVDNKFITPDLSPYGYVVRFRSEVDGGLDKTVRVPDSPNGNLSDSDDYVWLDLTGKDDTKPRLDVGGLDTSDTETELGGTDPNTYTQDAWNEVQNEIDNGGVNTIFNHTGPNGPNAAPNRRGEVKGTFAIEFQPKDGNFTNIKQISGGNFTDDCDAANETDLPSRCGLNDTGDREAVSTTRVNELDLLVTVEGPEGVSKREITVSPEEEFDIFGE